MKRFLVFLKNSEWQMSLWTFLFGTGGLVSSASLPAWAVSASNIWKPYSPLPEVIAGALGFLLFATVFLMVGLGRKFFSVAKLNNIRAKESTRINILKDHFQDEIIDLKDIFDPIHPRISGKDFRNCRFNGPMVMAFENISNFDNPGFFECNFIHLKEGDFVQSVTIIDSCNFRGCSFDRITFVLNSSTANNLSNISNGRIKVVGAPLPQPVGAK